MPVWAPNCKTTRWIGLFVDKQSIGSFKYGVLSVLQGPGSLELLPLKILWESAHALTVNSASNWRESIHELIKVSKEKIVDSEYDVSADRLKNAAATKKLAIFDAFEILNRIEEEKNILENKPTQKENTFQGFAERRSK